MTIKSLFSTLKSNVGYLLLVLLCTFPLMVFHVQSKVIIIWALVSFLLLLKSSKTRFTKDNLSLYFFNISWVLWLLITLIYSSDVLLGLKEFEKIISVIIIPFIIFFFTQKITARQSFVLFLTFTLSILCFTIYSYVYIINHFEVHYYALHLKEKSFDLWHYIK
ncbi:hypothetical protein OAX11_03085, partial [Flavobacteriaceae bacterium]|nr:hypothetical protein [Flavobacteriaceae bacterium]